MKRLKTLVLAIGFGLSLFSPVMAASDVGSHGWARVDLTLRAGPGSEHGVAGSIAEDSAVRILRCQINWCLVDGEGARGWTSREALSFGAGPDGPLFVVRPDYPAGGLGTVCFYEGRNYTGTSFCAGSGQVFSDLAAYGWDNRFSSVEVTGGVSAAACRERDFKSYCERIIESQPVLNQYLVRNLSSVRVY